ncbi:uncharacterized protein BDCG_16852 [Blastomyces dermatitidis ER-3]|uniref:Aminoglycoside phosphotransferase domain-containing protein n=1 Tax=Ajellomyces dermatitidis (strain ER-3 / ATCC MYA-2586) TaxID=559297 RepID=A0ABX2VV42_AJEDR|nr:uncharacterized protein BDCG_16852 [Blastomyces dermatitidis ER-3]OAT01022.1 hypothetical protein BDCG_16852 [Blastomyces dermatitidis ER-3]
MDEAAAARGLSLTHPNAAQWNHELMLEFQAALEKDPAADLMSIISDSYRREHRKAQYCELSYAAKINLRTVDELGDQLKHKPEVNLLDVFPKNYVRRIKMATAGRTAPSAEDTEKPSPPEFRTRLDLADSATVVFPLSETVTALLARYSHAEEPDGAEQALISFLKQLLWDSPKLWESSIRGVVVKCNEEVVAKVITSDTNDTTEYTAMQYLAERAPDIPAPKPHGLIRFGPFRVIFMSYIPDMTLAQVWSSLSPKEKVSIQQQLDDIFRRLRTLRQEDGNALGGVSGEGVKEYRVDECARWKDITTAREFSDLQFSACHHGSKTYIKFLRSFLEDESATMRGSVFTHGDVRRENIMVKQDPYNNNAYVVTGIIDWEDSGFYPEYYECTMLTCTLSLVDENDCECATASLAEVGNDYLGSRGFTTLHEVLLRINTSQSLEEFLDSSSRAGDIAALIDQPDYHHRTPLTWAVEFGWVYAVRTLLKYGANPHKAILSERGKSTLLHLVLAGPCSQFSKGDFNSVVEVLLAEGVDINARDHEGS